MTVINRKDAEIRTALLTAARELVAQDANFSLKMLLTQTGVSRARFRRCFADKDQLVAALTGEEVKSLGEILQAAQPEAARAVMGSDIAPVSAPVHQIAPGADAWLERRLRVFERALAGLEKRQEKAEQELTHQLAVMAETLTAFVQGQSALKQAGAPEIRSAVPAGERMSRFEPAKAEIPKTEAEEAAPAQTEIIETQSSRPEPNEVDMFAHLEEREEEAPRADASETAFATDIAAVTPPTDREISEFMAHARRVAQNASAAEIAQPERPWNRRWLAWGGAVLLTLIFGTGVLLASGAFGGPAGANPVMPVSGVSHRQVAQSGIAHVIALADSGDAGAQTQLAIAYLSGNGVARDNDAARRWSLAAAGQGQPVAQYLAGTLYLQENPNDSEAVRWFRAAAAQGNVKAMHNLAIAYAEGQGVNKDPVEAVAWFARAAALGYRDSEFDLAVLYERGMGVSQSARDALKWYLIAAASGDMPSAGRAKVLQEQVDPMIYRLAIKDAAGFVAQPAGKAANQTPNI